MEEVEPQFQGHVSLRGSASIQRHSNIPFTPSMDVSCVQASTAQRFFLWKMACVSEFLSGFPEKVENFEERFEIKLARLLDKPGPEISGLIYARDWKYSPMPSIERLRYKFSTLLLDVEELKSFGPVLHSDRHEFEPLSNAHCQVTDTGLEALFGRLDAWSYRGLRDHDLVFELIKEKDIGLKQARCSFSYYDETYLLDILESDWHSVEPPRGAWDRFLHEVRSSEYRHKSGDKGIRSVDLPSIFLKLRECIDTSLEEFLCVFRGNWLQICEPSSRWSKIIIKMARGGPEMWFDLLSEFEFLDFCANSASSCETLRLAAIELKRVAIGIRLLTHQVDNCQRIFRATIDRAKKHRSIQACIDHLERAKQASLPNSFGDTPSAMKSATRRGLKLLVNGRTVKALADTGASENFIDADYVKSHGLSLRKNSRWFKMGNGNRLCSPGTVTMKVAFMDAPETFKTITARVVHKFPFDLLLSCHFLRETGCLLQRFAHRLVPCIFKRLKSALSFAFLGLSTERFLASLGRNINVATLLDTGSNCNIMDATFAAENGFHIERGDEHRGVIRYPSGDSEWTIGKVYTTITLPDGRVELMNFDIIPHCVVPVILRDEFIFNNNLYENYPDAFVSIDDVPPLDNLLHLDYIPWYAKVVGKTKRMLKLDIAEKSSVSTKKNTPHVGEGDELERQYNWDIRYENGNSASATERKNENRRRKAHEARLIKSSPPGLI